MKLFILRHGAAGQRNLRKYPNDAARPLTSAGKRETLRIARRLFKDKVEFDQIISSPFIRARQTAEIVAKVYTRDVRFTPHLTPDGLMPELIKYVNRTCKDADSVVLVGHEPYLSTLISVLISGKEGANIRLKKGGMLKMDVGSLRFGRCARLDWLLTPRQLGA